MTTPTAIASLRSIDASEPFTADPLGPVCLRVLRAQSLVRAIRQLAMSAEAGALGDVLNLAHLAVVELEDIHDEMDRMEVARA